MHVVINIYTVSGFIVQAFAVMPRSVYEELSGAEISTDILPLWLCESLIPAGRRCFLAPAHRSEYKPFDELGQGLFPGSRPASISDRKESWFKRCINWFKSLYSIPVIENHI